LTGGGPESIPLAVLLIINGEPREVPDDATVAGVLASLSIEPTGVAVEVNQQIVRRARHAEHHLRPDDRIEIVTFVGGG
jgi:sulfur carrier protein